MRKVIALLGVAALVVVSSCSSANQGAPAGSTSTRPTGTLAPPTAAKAAALAWDADAVARNGAMPAAEAAPICGAADRRFLGEMLKGNPLDFKVPKRLADVKASPSQMMVSGTVEDSVIGAGDFPFDHTMGSDFNADVKLDQPFVGVGQEGAKPIETLHVELAAGQIPHTVSAPMPDSLIWREMTAKARENIQQGFVPRKGDRVLVMGNWIVDCGHTNFQTEIHPISFMAVARTEGDATVVHLFYNPWRESQLYNPDPAKALAFEDPTRFSDPNTVPFPKGLIDSMFRLQDAGPPPFTSVDRLSSWALLEPNTTSPSGFKVCAPDGGAGTPKVGATFVTRNGVKIDVTPGSDGCATVKASIDAMTPGKPTPKVCKTPWDFLSEVASEEAGGDERTASGGSPEAKVDLKKELGKFIAVKYQSRMDADPVMNCYDALSGPDLGGARPTSVDVRADPSALLPFYGTIVIRRA